MKHEPRAPVPVSDHCSILAFRHFLSDTICAVSFCVFLVDESNRRENAKDPHYTAALADRKVPG